MEQARAASRRDAWIALGALLALAMWEASGGDLALTRWVATSHGFAWRDSLLASRLLHDGGRALGWALLALLVSDAVRPLWPWPPRSLRSLPPEGADPPLERPGGGSAPTLAALAAPDGADPPSERPGGGSAPTLAALAAPEGSGPPSERPRGGPGPSRTERVRGIGVVVAGLVLVPMLKRFSATSCPWDLVEFGGRAAYVPHWLIGLEDGGPGHCFPSGHAVAAFAFFGVYFVWRHYRPRFARAVLMAVLSVGFAFGWAQWVRGAHFVSHTLWSAWLCWVIAALAARYWPAGRGAVSPRTPGAAMLPAR